MCERSWYSVLRINMQTTHAMLLWTAYDGRNADDVISARRPADLDGSPGCLVGRRRHARTGILRGYDWSRASLRVSAQMVMGPGHASRQHGGRPPLEREPASARIVVNSQWRAQSLAADQGSQVNQVLAAPVQGTAGRGRVIRSGAPLHSDRACIGFQPGVVRKSSGLPSTPRNQVRAFSPSLGTKYPPSCRISVGKPRLATRRPTSW
jgi:hypothetical protein